MKKISFNHFLEKLQKEKIYLVLLLNAVVIIELLFLVGLQTGVLFFNKQPQTLQEYADKVIQTCADRSYRPSCYDEEIPKTMDHLTMEEAFEVTKLIQAKDDGYWYCHVLGHNLSAREVAKDPVNWKDVLNRCPSGVCSNGCLHGGLQERFRAESLNDEQIEEVLVDLDVLCEEREGFHPTGLEQASCYHAIGHLTMYITAADVEKSINICDRIAIRDDGRNFLRACYEGAFMQIFQPLEAEDFALVMDITPEKEDLYDYCFAFPPDQSDACWREGWPLYWDEIRRPTGVIDFCTYSSDLVKQQHCYNSMFYVLTAQLNFNQEKIVSYCKNIPLKEVQSQCFANAASRTIETDWELIHNAIAICEAAASFGVADDCYRELVFYSTFNFHPDSDDFFNLCNSMPEPWKAKCLNKEAVFPDEYSEKL